MVSRHNRQNKNWRVLDHTADLRIEVQGLTLEELFFNAAAALSHLIGGDVAVSNYEYRVLKLEAPSLEELLVEWLRELLFEYQVNGKAFVEAEALHISDASLEAKVSFGRVSQDQVLQFEIKGVTYHGLKIVNRGGKYVVRIIFDV